MEGYPPIQLPPGCFKFGRAGAAVLLARICHELRIQKLVNAMVKYDVKQCKVSPGTLVVAMIINLLAACLSNRIYGRTLPCSRVREQHEQTISYLSTKPVLPNAAIA
jgi:hypothetical protein